MKKTLVIFWCLLLVAAAYSLESLNLSPRAAERLSGMFVHDGSMNGASVEAGVEVNQRAEVSGLYVKLFTGQETIEAVYFLDFPSRQIELAFPTRSITATYEYPLTGPQINYYRAIDTMDRVIARILEGEGITYNSKIRLFNDERSKPAYSIMFPPDNKRFILFKQNRQYVFNIPFKKNEKNIDKLAGVNNLINYHFQLKRLKEGLDPRVRK